MFYLEEVLSDRESKVPDLINCVACRISVSHASRVLKFIEQHAERAFYERFRAHRDTGKTQDEVPCDNLRTGTLSHLKRVRAVLPIVGLAAESSAANDQLERAKEGKFVDVLLARAPSRASISSQSLDGTHRDWLNSEFFDWCQKTSKQDGRSNDTHRDKSRTCPRQIENSLPTCGSPSVSSELLPTNTSQHAIFPVFLSCSIVEVPSGTPFLKEIWESMNKNIWPLSGPRPRQRPILSSKTSLFDHSFEEGNGNLTDDNSSVTPKDMSALVKNTEAVTRLLLLPLKRAAAERFYSLASQTFPDENKKNAEDPVVSIVADLSNSTLAEDLDAVLSQWGEEIGDDGQHIVSIKHNGVIGELPAAIRSIRVFNARDALSLSMQTSAGGPYASQKQLNSVASRSPIAEHLLNEIISYTTSSSSSSASISTRDGFFEGDGENLNIPPLVRLPMVKHSTFQALLDSSLTSYGVFCESKKANIQRQASERNSPKKREEIIALPVMEDLTTVGDASGTGDVDYLCNSLDVLSTHEPCLMCAMACVHSRVRRVIFLRRADTNGYKVMERESPPAVSLCIQDSGTERRVAEAHPPAEKRRRIESKSARSHHGGFSGNDGCYKLHTAESLNHRFPAFEAFWV